jgi:hypothetical protein
MQFPAGLPSASTTTTIVFVPSSWRPTHVRRARYPRAQGPVSGVERVALARAGVGTAAGDDVQLRVPPALQPADDVERAIVGMVVDHPDVRGVEPRPQVPDGLPDDEFLVAAGPEKMPLKERRVAGPGGAVPLATTGANLTWWIVFGVVSLVLGVVLVRSARRRAPESGDWSSLFFLSQPVSRQKPRRTRTGEQVMHPWANAGCSPRCWPAA